MGMMDKSEAKSVITISGHMNNPDGMVTAYCICGQEWGYTYEMSLTSLNKWASNHSCSYREKKRS